MTPNEKFIQKWVSYLNDVDREMSVMAAQKLGNARESSAVPELIKALKGRPDDIRMAAARALGAIGDASAVPELVKLLNDNNAVLASAAADSLGEIGDPAAVPALVTILKNYKGEQSRHRQLHGFDRGLFMAAVYALEKINTGEARRAVATYHR